MVGLRSENEIDVWRPAQYRVAFLARDTSTHTNQEVWIGFLPWLPSTQLRKQFLLCFFPHRARVQQQEIGLFGVVCRTISMRNGKRFSQPGRIVLVHLTAKGLDVEFFVHCV